MDLVKKLLQADTSKVNKKKKATIKSKELAEIIGESEPTEITITEIEQRSLNNILAMQVDEKGDYNFDKSFDAKLIMITEGVVDPPLRDEDVLKHFGCKTSKDLAEKLFGSEITKISDAIGELSGVNESDKEEIKIIKN